MAPTRHDLDVAFHRGKERGLSGGSDTENPHNPLRFGQRNLLHFAWLAGFKQGLMVRALASS